MVRIRPIMRGILGYRVCTVEGPSLYFRKLDDAVEYLQGVYWALCVSCNDFCADTGEAPMDIATWMRRVEQICNTTIIVVPEKWVSHRYILYGRVFKTWAAADAAQKRVFAALDRARCTYTGMVGHPMNRHVQCRTRTSHRRPGLHGVGSAVSRRMGRFFPGHVGRSN